MGVWPHRPTALSMYVIQTTCKKSCGLCAWELQSSMLSSQRVYSLTTCKRWGECIGSGVRYALTLQAAASTAHLVPDNIPEVHGARMISAGAVLLTVTQEDWELGIAGVKHRVLRGVKLQQPPHMTAITGRLQISMHLA